MAAPNPKPAKGRTGGRQTVSYINVKGRAMDAVVTGGSGAVNEVQTLTETAVPTAGTFTLSWRGYTTAAIAFDASAATIKTAFLAAVPIILTTELAVAGGPLNTTPVTFTFSGRYAGTNQPAITVTPNATFLVDGTIAIAETTAGAQATALNLFVPSLPQANRRKTGIAKRTSLTQTNVWAPTT